MTILIDPTQSVKEIRGKRSDAGQMTPSLFRYPQWVFSALGILTPLTYVACGVCCYYYGHYTRNFIPFPSSVVATTPERYIYGWSATVVVPLMLLAIWRVRKYLAHPNRFTTKSLVTTVLPYLCPLLGVASAFFYGAAAFWTATDGLWWHLLFHLASLSTLSLFFIAFDLAVNFTRAGTHLFVVIYDIATSIVIAVYASTAYYIMNRVMGLLFTIWTIGGYIGITLLFIRFIGVGIQITASPAAKRHR